MSDTGVVVITACWSRKGGVGTTTIAAAVALLSAEARPTTLVDLRGDALALMGLPDGDGPGLAEWLAASEPGPVERLAVIAGPNLTVIPRGRVTESCTERLVDVLADWDAEIVIDAGVVDDGDPVGGPAVFAADRSILVTRACFLALRRAQTLPFTPTDVVLVAEPGRALTATDVGEVVGVPVTSRVPIDPAVARAIDAGLIASRLPRPLRRSLRALAR